MNSVPQKHDILTNLPYSARGMSSNLRWLGVVRRAGGRYNSAMKFRLLLDYDPQAGRWSAVFPDLPGCASAGDTEEQAVANAKEDLALWFDSTPVDIPKNGKLLEVALP